MKKKLPLIVIPIVLYMLIMFLSGYYIIYPGVSKLKEANNLKELTFEERTDLTDEIKQRYTVLEKEIDDKYTPTLSEISSKYDKLEKELDAKYKKQEQEIDKKYDAKETELNSKINDKKIAKQKEFFANGFSKKYYNIQDEITKLEEEKFNLDIDKNKELKEVATNKKNELSKLNSSKNAEINPITDNRTSELTKLYNNKKNELDEIENRDSIRNGMKVTAILIILLGSVVILIPVIYLVMMFNKLTKLHNVVKSKWSEVDIYLKQRSDLIPSIVEAIKGYSKHEKGTLTEVTKARSQVVSAKSRQEEINANETLSDVVGKLFVLAENYPDLKADQNFMSLQRNLKEIEDNIALSRRRYNQAVLEYKNEIELFPSNIAASIFSFKNELFFEITKEEKENPEIKFN